MLRYAQAERKADEALYARAARLFRAHVDAAADGVRGGLFRAMALRTHAFRVDSDAKVKHGIA